jgi:hypothetical protein
VKPGRDEATIQMAMAKSLGAACRAGYPLSDEMVGIAGLAIAIALKEYDDERQASFSSYCATLLLNMLSKEEYRQMLEFDDEVFIARRFTTDYAQQMLTRVSEPDYSICHAVWIEGRTRKEVAAETGLSIREISDILDYTASRVREYLEDI